MRCQRLIRANETLLQRQLQRGFLPAWYVVYHLNDGLNSRHQQLRRLDPDEVSKDVAFHKHTLYQTVYGNRRWSKMAHRARSFWTIEYGINRDRPLINMLTETLPDPFGDARYLQNFFDLTLPLRAKSVFFDFAHIQPVVPTTEMRILSYSCKETDQSNVSIDYYSTDWIL